MFDDGWINTGVHVPVTSESDRWAFQFDGLLWTLFTRE